MWLSPWSSQPRSDGRSRRAAGRRSHCSPDPRRWTSTIRRVSCRSSTASVSRAGQPQVRVEDGAIVGGRRRRIQRQQLHRLSRSGGEGLHAEVRIKVVAAAAAGSMPQPDGTAVAGEHRPQSATWARQPDLDDDGPQADFWPSRVYTGQFYSENTPMRILAGASRWWKARAPATRPDGRSGIALRSGTSSRPRWNQ